MTACGRSRAVWVPVCGVCTPSRGPVGGGSRKRSNPTGSRRSPPTGRGSGPRSTPTSSTGPGSRPNRSGPPAGRSAPVTELARRAGLSPSGVSQYLTALRDAGLVSAHRAGRSVLYARTSVADSLLAGAAP
ncbi:ArsR/SmtB family transcription factor [Streptomyces sp. NPDC059447]|uniref:ArsR/SmtB family transcription factor n=1 Tax=Streptomyces sp. NPDC059447 TaxID=3346834 RepID=UPI0036D0E684